MANYTLAFVLFSVIAASMASVSRHKRQMGGMCSQPNGLFPIDGSCHQFIVCEDDRPSILTCPDRLAFNPQTQSCDHAFNVNGCENEGNPSDPLCENNPGKPGESWKVAHPNYCNAFYTCESYYIHRRCEFCGEGTYFSEKTGMCVFLDKTNPPAECSQKQEVPHTQKSTLEVYPDCVLFVDNPFRELVDKIQGRIGQAEVPSNSNRGYLWQ